MNFIQRLLNDKENLKIKLNNIETEINNYLIFLNGPKFKGTENGERKDWISTSDLILFLQELKKHTFN